MYGVENTVYIIGEDEIFARLLELELRDAGIAACRVESFPRRGGLAVVESTALAAWRGAFSEVDALIEIGFGDAPTIEGAVYFRRPFPMDEFIERTRSMLCRIEEENPNRLADSEESEGCRRENEKAPSREGELKQAEREAGLIYDSEENQFFYSGEHIALTETETALLSLLYERRGETVSREEILYRVWGRAGEYDPKTNLTDVYIRYLREKLDDRFSVKLILAVRGKGYMLKG